MDFLITGGAGFIGSNLIEELLRLNTTAKVVILDNFSTGKKENIPQDDRIAIIEGDVSDFSIINNLFYTYHFDYIFHLAAVSNVQDSIMDPVVTHKINFDSTLLLLEKTRKINDFKRFIFASSAAVYGNKPKIPCSEKSAVNPISPYGIDKYASERYVINYCKLYGIPTTAFRFFNIYGPRQNPSSPYSGVISIFAQEFQKSSPQISIYGDGKQTRDFVFIKDLVEILLNSLQYKETVGECINVCTGIETSINNVIDIFSNLSKKQPKILYKDQRIGDIKSSVGNNEKIINYNLKNEFIHIDVGLSKYFLTL